VTTFPLCILTPELGALVHTFIRRHIEDLLPNRTAVAGNKPGLPVPADWSPPGPLHDLAAAGGAGLVGRVARAAARELRWPLESGSLRRFLRRNDVEVVMGQYLDYSIPWIDAARSAGCRFFAHAHGHDVSGRLTEPRWRQAYRRYAETDGVITINQPSRSALIDVGIPAEKVHVVHYGVHVAPDLPKPWPRHGRTLACIAVGRMVPQKAPILLLDSFRRAFLEEPRLHLHYVGSGPLLAGVEEFITAFGLHDAVTLHSWKSNTDVRSMMREATMFLQHSMVDPHTGDAEGLPLAILEAMAEGLPVVSTIHTGIPEAVVEGRTGFLVTEGDSAAMADRILRIAGDADLRDRLGREGHARALDLFTWDRERRRLLDVLGLSGQATNAPPVTSGPTA